MADYQSKYTGNQVEALLDIVSQGGGEGGEVQKTTEAEITAMGFTKNQGTITEVKMNGVSKGTEGVVDLGTVLTEHQDISGKQDKIEDLDAIRAGAAAGATALQEEQYKGTVTGVTFYGKDYSPDSDGKVYMGYPDVGAVKEITVNGSTKTPANGVVDLGTVLTQHQDISQKADLSNGKIVASQLPDYILGQVMYGGIINSGDANSIVVQPSENYKAKYTLDGSTITINKYQFWGQQGVYFISNADGTFLDKEVKKGDWLISTGSGVAKVDNTDAVSSVAGLTGVIDASALGKELSYNDLKDKPTIPSAVTESTVSGWGFTKNTGTYSKPSGGIPKTDLASAVQTSLNKADSAVAARDFGNYKYADDLDGIISKGQVYYSLPDSVSDVSIEDDIIVTVSTLKTINGQSLVGSGDITISGGSGSGKKEVVYWDAVSGETITSMRPNVIYWILDHENITIESFEEAAPEVESYDLFTAILALGVGYSEISLTLPDYVLWANGTIPELDNDEQIYELSISRISDGYGWNLYSAVLTPFKQVE